MRFPFWAWVVVVIATQFAAAQSTPRTVTSLNSGWRFNAGDVSAAATVDDSTWQPIDLPHTWNNLDGQDGHNNYRRGPSWYRKHLPPDPAWAGKTVYLWFGAANIDSAVYVNDKPAGVHRGGFGAFCFDVTSLLNATGDNVVAVRVDNSPDRNVAPLDADFTFFGGLYRGAKLIVTSPLCISPIDDASPGVYAKQTGVTADAATLTVTAKLRNSGATAASAAARFQLIDAQGLTVATTNATQTVPGGASADVTATLQLSKPHLWAGRPDPYVYSLVTTLGDGTVATDAVTVPVGFRFYNADPSTGFYLNGKSYPLHGVSRHQDRLDKGWAVSVADHQSDFANMMDMGCTAVRLAHYEHAPEFYDLCDRGGIVAWAEIPIVNHVTATAEFDDNASQQLRELIKQNFNCPSIVCWGLSNELRQGDRTEIERREGRHQIELQTRLNAEAHALDPTRPTTSASLRGPGSPLDGITDLIAYNRYNGWYEGKATDWPGYLDRLHAANPDRAVGISEYGAGASIGQHEVDVKQPRPNSRWHPEEWQCVVHENAWAAMKARPWLWCTFVWNLHDFAVDGRNEGDTLGRNDKGMVTYDGKTKKDVFYFYKANWTTDPMVYITERRFTPRPVADAPVKVYSNCDAVMLTLNGESVSTTGGNDPTTFVFDHAVMKPGDNILVATGTKGEKTVTDTITITVDPTAKDGHPLNAASGSTPATQRQKK